MKKVEQNTNPKQKKFAGSTKKKQHKDGDKESHTSLPHDIDGNRDKVDDDLYDDDNNDNEDGNEAVSTHQENTSNMDDDAEDLYDEEDLETPCEEKGNKKKDNSNKDHSVEKKISSAFGNSKKFFANKMKNVEQNTNEMQKKFAKSITKKKAHKDEKDNEEENHASISRDANNDDDDGEGADLYDEDNGIVVDNTHQENTSNVDDDAEDLYDEEDLETPCEEKRNKKKVNSNKKLSSAFGNSKKFFANKMKNVEQNTNEMQKKFAKSITKKKAHKDGEDNEEESHVSISRDANSDDDDDGEGADLYDEDDGIVVDNAHQENTSNVHDDAEDLYDEEVCIESSKKEKKSKEKKKPHKLSRRYLLEKSFKKLEINSEIMAKKIKENIQLQKQKMLQMNNKKHPNQMKSKNKKDMDDDDIYDEDDGAVAENDDDDDDDEDITTNHELKAVEEDQNQQRRDEKVKREVEENKNNKIDNDDGIKDKKVNNNVKLMRRSFDEKIKAGKEQEKSCSDKRLELNNNNNDDDGDGDDKKDLSISVETKKTNSGSRNEEVKLRKVKRNKSNEVDVENDRIMLEKSVDEMLENMKQQLLKKYLDKQIKRISESIDLSAVMQSEMKLDNDDDDEEDNDDNDPVLKSIDQFIKRKSANILKRLDNDDDDDDDVSKTTTTSGGDAPEQEVELSSSEESFDDPDYEEHLMDILKGKMHLISKNVDKMWKFSAMRKFGKKLENSPMVQKSNKSRMGASEGDKHNKKKKPEMNIDDDIYDDDDDDDDEDEEEEDDDDDDEDDNDDNEEKDQKTRKTSSENVQFQKLGKFLKFKSNKSTKVNVSSTSNDIAVAAVPETEDGSEKVKRKGSSFMSKGKTFLKSSVNNQSKPKTCKVKVEKQNVEIEDDIYDDDDDDDD